MAELTERRKAHGLPGLPRLPGLPSDFRGGRPWPQPTGDRYLLWGSVAYCLCQGTQDTTRTPSPSCLALAEWHICQPVISSKLKGDTALCSGKPEDHTNSKSEGRARDLDYFFHVAAAASERNMQACVYEEVLPCTEMHPEAILIRGAAAAAQERRRREQLAN